MNALKLSAVSFIVLALLLPAFTVGCFASDEEEVAASAVEGARVAVAEAYEAVSEAEEAGADVSSLLDRLAVAAEYLALANVCLRRGDFDGAVGNASLCVEALDGMVDDAGVLRDRAARWSSERSRMAVGGSAMGVAVVVCASFLSWGLFKKRYYERVSEMKPEVVESES